MTAFQALSRSVSQREQSQYHAFQMENSPSNGAVNFDRFFENVEAIKNELRDLETLYNQLQTANEQSENLHNQESIKDLRSKMDNQVVSSLMELGFLRTRLQALHRSTTADDSHFLKWMGCLYILIIVIILVITLFTIRPWG